MFLNTHNAVQSLLNYFDIKYGNILHYAVYTRDIDLFQLNKNNTQLLNEKFENCTPIELANKLGYSEFTAENEIQPAFYIDICLREACFDKYINPIIGYETRKVKMTVNNFYSVSKKITEIPIEEMSIKQERNKLIIKYKNTKYKFTTQDKNELDIWYTLLQSKEDRIKEAEKIKEKSCVNNKKRSYNDVSENPYIFMLINKILAEKINDPNVFDILSVIQQLNLYLNKNNLMELQNNSSDDFFSSESSEFYDFEENMIYTFKIYRNALPHKTCSSFEPLSYLQRLTEQFQFINTIKERENDLNLFIEIVSYILNSYAIFRNRTKKCFEPFLCETYTNKDNDYEVFVEKSDINNINLILFSNELVFIINNFDVEIRISDWLVTYQYNLTRLDTVKLNTGTNSKYNIINSVTNVKMYKHNSNYNQGNDKNADLFLHTQEELNNFDLVLFGDIYMKNDKVSGTIKRKRKTEVVLKGIWYETVNYKYSGKKNILWQNKTNTYKNYYDFSLYTIQLNHHIKCLKSDSRNREDIRALENGDVMYSRECNEVLENRERIRKDENRMFKPKFFKYENERWVFVSGNVKNDTSFTKND